jgi:superfamily I DNA/RNA helicase
MKDFEKLNKYQMEAVTLMDKHVILNAVVGSGKTTVLTHKIMYLNQIKEVPFEEMIVLTFTNKAANEIRERVSAFQDEIGSDMKYFGTFHSVARTLLLESAEILEMGYTKEFDIIDNEKAAEMLVDIIERDKLKIKYKAKLMKRIEEFKKEKTLYGVMKNQDDIGELYQLYGLEKVKNNIMDFDDLIENCITILDEPLNPKWIIVDEFQDTDIRQLQMIKRLGGVDTSIFVIGDPNQVIYSWRTGNDNIFNEFKNSFDAKEITLPINYRSSRTIIEAAKSLLKGSNIEGIMGYGNPIIIRKHFDSFNEALHIARKIRELHDEGILYRDIGILYRRQAQGEVLADVLSRNEIPSKTIFKKPLPFEESEDNNYTEEGVNLLTLHASKGLEFSHVFIVGVNMGNIPLTTKRVEEEEEVRLFFVGMTRAKNFLEISYVIKPGLPGMTSYPSPYLSMIPSNLVEREEEGKSSTLPELMELLRQDREFKREEENIKKVRHEKYGLGKVLFEDDSIIRVEFEGYGEKEFSKMFSPLIIE